MHNAPPLVYNEELAKSCQEWAEYNKSIGQMKHSDDRMADGSWYGENLAGGSCCPGYFRNNQKATEMWYAEVSDYNY